MLISRCQLGDGSSCGLIDEQFFQVLLLFGIEVVIVFGSTGEGFRKDLLAASTHFPLGERRFGEPVRDWKMASGLDARRRWRAVSANPTEPLRLPSSWSALPISVLT